MKKSRCKLCICSFSQGAEVVFLTTSPCTVNTTAPLPPATRDSLPHVALPHSYKPIKIVVGSMDCDHTTLACTELLVSARRGASNVPGGVVVFGIDAEWSVWATGVRPVAVVQLSTIEGYTVVFHIKPNERRVGVFPKALKELLENGDVPLVSEREYPWFCLVGGRHWCVGKYPVALF